MARKGLLTFLACGLLVVAMTVATAPAQDRELVTKVQSALKEKGFDPGPIDGIMGPRTRKALRDFQIKNDIQVTGEINQETLDRLGIKGGLMGRIGSGVRTASDAVSDAAVTAAKSTAKGARVAADASVTAAQAAASGARTGARATTVGAKTAASGATTGAKATTKGARAAAGGATTGGKAVASGATQGVKTARGWLPGGKGGDLASRVESRLQKDSGVNAEHVEVRTEGKNVYLIFSGGSQAEWNRAVSVARKVDGVDNVFIRLPE